MFGDGWTPVPASLKERVKEIQVLADRVLIAPIVQQGFIWGVGSRVEQPAAGLIAGFAYVGPPEDPKLK